MLHARSALPLLVVAWPRSRHSTRRVEASLVANVAPFPRLSVLFNYNSSFSDFDKPLRPAYELEPWLSKLMVVIFVGWRCYRDGGQ